MLYWSVKIIIISFILIFLIHHLIKYFTSILTIPKEKDLYASNNLKYELLNNILIDGNKTESKAEEKNESVKDEFNMKDESKMKNELKNFLKSQMALPSSASNERIGYTNLDALYT